MPVLPAVRRLGAGSVVAVVPRVMDPRKHQWPEHVVRYVTDHRGNPTVRCTQPDCEVNRKSTDAK